VFGSATEEVHQERTGRTGGVHQAERLRPAADLVRHRRNSASGIPGTWPTRSARTCPTRCDSRRERQPLTDRSAARRSRLPVRRYRLHRRAEREGPQERARVHEVRDGQPNLAMMVPPRSGLRGTRTCPRRRSTRPPKGASPSERSVGAPLKAALHGGERGLHRHDAVDRPEMPRPGASIERKQHRADRQRGSPRAAAPAIHGIRDRPPTRPSPGRGSARTGLPVQPRAASE
jgi:hypothetical protein